MFYFLLITSHSWWYHLYSAVCNLHASYLLLYCCFNLTNRHNAIKKKMQHCKVKDIKRQLEADQNQVLKRTFGLKSWFKKHQNFKDMFFLGLCYHLLSPSGFTISDPWSGSQQTRLKTLIRIMELKSFRIRTRKITPHEAFRRNVLWQHDQNGCPSGSLSSNHNKEVNIAQLCCTVIG